MAAQFPQLTDDGLMCQLPYTEIDRWVTAEASLDCGFSSTRSENNSVLRCWTLDFSSITRAELTLLESFFELMRGRTGEFELKVRFDDGGTHTFARVRFDQEALDVTYPEPGRFSVTINLCQRGPT